MAVSGGVFISYRRDDSGGFAGRIYDRLAERFGDDFVFFDVNDIPPGLDFFEVLSQRIGACDTLVVVIGKNWLGAVSKENRRRLDDPDDIVRMEIEAALKRGVPVIPVLVEGATMPGADELPTSLKKLPRLQNIEISLARFNSDVDVLIHALSTLGNGSAKADDHHVPPVALATIPRTLASPAEPSGEEAPRRPAPDEFPPRPPPQSPDARAGARRSLTVAGVAVALALGGAALFFQHWATRKPGDKAPQSPTQPTERRPGDVFAECTHCPEMVVVPAGEFAMGSSAADIESRVSPPNEGPQHRVVIAHPFALARAAVTRDQFKAFVAATFRTLGDSCNTSENGVSQERADRSFLHPGFDQTGAHPAICVNWSDAKAYADWLSQTTGKTYRLPTEAEYEYSARAGSRLRYGFTDNVRDLCTHLNGLDQSAKGAGLPGPDGFLECSDGYVYTAPVRSFPSNAFGVFDLQGNAWEWTRDCYRDTYQAASPDGSTPASELCATRTVRGGSWGTPALYLRPAARAEAKVNAGYDDVGFRVVRELAR